MPKEVRFTKMHGLGNDFVLIDCTKADVPNIRSVVTKLSDRRVGVGFDQALILKKSKKADFRMDIYNSDGSMVEMCGNGIRCLAHYIWTKKLSAKRTLDIETLAGIKRPSRHKGLVRVDMGAPILEGSLIPVRKTGLVVDHKLKAGDKTFLVTCVSMGNPHCVVFVDNVDAFPVAKYGPLIETDPFFPKRTNVEFIEVKSKKRIRMRVWERGSGETLACGTGACAAAVATGIKGRGGRNIDVELPLGVLNIEWAKDDRVYMTGPAKEVFTGVARV